MQQYNFIQHFENDINSPEDSYYYLNIYYNNFYYLPKNPGLNKHIMDFIFDKFCIESFLYLRKKSKWLKKFKINEKDKGNKKNRYTIIEEEFNKTIKERGIEEKVVWKNLFSKTSRFNSNKLEEYQDKEESKNQRIFLIRILKKIEDIEEEDIKKGYIESILREENKFIVQISDFFNFTILFFSNLFHSNIFRTFHHFIGFSSSIGLIDTSKFIFIRNNKERNRLLRLNFHSNYPKKRFINHYIGTINERDNFEIKLKENYKDYFIKEKIKKKHNKENIKEFIENDVDVETIKDLTKMFMITENMIFEKKRGLEEGLKDYLTLFDKNIILGGEKTNKRKHCSESFMNQCYWKIDKESRTNKKFIKRMNRAWIRNSNSNKSKLEKEKFKELLKKNRDKYMYASNPIYSSIIFRIIYETCNDFLKERNIWIFYIEELLSHIYEKDSCEKKQNKFFGYFEYDQHSSPRKNIKNNQEKDTYSPSYLSIIINNMKIETKNKKYIERGSFNIKYTCNVFNEKEELYHSIKKKEYEIKKMISKKIVEIINQWLNITKETKKNKEKREILEKIKDRIKIIYKTEEEEKGKMIKTCYQVSRITIKKEEEKINKKRKYKEISQ